MLEGLALSVDVGQKVLGTLGQVQDRFQIDYFGACFSHRGEGLRKQCQVMLVGLNV